MYLKKNILSYLTFFAAWKDCFLIIIISDSSPPSRHQRAIKCSEVTFPCTRVKREISRFISEDTLSFVRQNLSRHTRAVGDIPRKHLACCEKRRETTRLSPFAYIIYSDGVSRVSRERNEAEAGGPCRE